jgi:hypothetical protein
MRDDAGALQLGQRERLARIDPPHIHVAAGGIGARGAMCGKPLHVQEVIEALSPAAFGWKKHQQEARQEGRRRSRS